MSAYTTIARPYAKAAFEYAVEKNAIAEWEFFLKVAGMIVRDQRMHAVLQNPQLDKTAKLKLLSEMCALIVKRNHHKEQNNLLALLAEYNRFFVIPELAGLFNKLVKQHDNTVDVTVTSAFTFSTEQQQKLRKALEIRLGKRIKMEVTENKSLIGGAIIRAGDFVIDGSIQSKLKRLRKAVSY